jgi:broad specificity phosphatase PhoE
MTEVQARAWPALKGIVAAHPGQALAVVAHGAVNRVILARILNVPLQSVLYLEQDYGCLNVLNFQPDRIAIKGLNLRPGPYWTDQKFDQT